MTKEYKARRQCTNCMGHNEFVIQKGTTVKEFLEKEEDLKCIYCECKFEEYKK